MIGRHTQTGMGTGGGRGIWPVLLLLLAAVLVPTGCVLWFMNAAMTNERLAVRQRLTEVYKQQLLDAKERLDEHWAARRRALEAGGNLPAPERFEKLVRTAAADAVIIYDASGNVAYPIVGAPPASPPAMPPPWEEAAGLEGAGEFVKAAEAYGQLAKAEPDIDRRAQALQGQARCLVRADRADDALAILAGTLGKDEYRAARDTHGRLIAPDALMHALRLTRPRDGQPYRTIRDELDSRLTRYDGPAMPSSQRLFLMAELRDETGIAAPTFDAERLAAEFLDGGSARPGGDGLRPTGTGLWALPSSDGRTLGLFTDATVAKVVDSLLPVRSALAGASVIAHHGPSPATEAEPFLTVPASSHMPDWHMSLYLDRPDPFAATAAQRNAAYLWTGGLGIGFIVVLAVAMASYVGRQMRLTRLKNDLIATVSHELKTPLASMRVLVDTLRDGRCADAKQAGEYFDLIARENERLSRLIDNFLTFSRMERNKRAFEFAPVDMGEVVQAAVSAVHDRFASPESRLEVDLPAEIPPVRADRDALVTVLLNLLDNAWKYSGDDKAVEVRAFAADGSVFIEVSDNGVGMSRRAQRRIFDKFYQVDQTLSRRAGGCGLGLSIVKFILDAHGGTISVKSQPGKGSTFTVTLPAAEVPRSAP